MARGIKNSGVNWITEIPKTWSIINIRSLFSFGKGLPITKEDLKETGVPVISYGQIHSKDNNGITVKKELIRYVDTDFLSKNPDSLVSAGDFIFADTSEDLSGCGNNVYIDTDAYIFSGYHTIILRNKTGKDQRYLAFLFQSDIWRRQIRERVTGVKLFSISQKILRTTSVLVPPTDEQKKIVSFLTAKCKKIDLTIEQTRASIEEYKKLKQAVITHAVTKGIRLDRPMKDSGSSWIGMIPIGWDAIISRFVLDQIGDVDHYMPESVDAGVPYVMTGDLKKTLSDIDFESCKKISSVDYEALSKKIKPSIGDIVFARYATIGTVCYVDIERDCIISYSCVTIKPTRNKLYGKFLYYYLQASTFFEDVSQYINSNTQENVGIEALYNVKVPVPTMAEQYEISDYLDKKTVEIDGLIQKKEQLLSELTEYKKALIFEYVTGKKEVM